MTKYPTPQQVADHKWPYVKPSNREEWSANGVSALLLLAKTNGIPFDDSEKAVVEICKQLLLENPAFFRFFSDINGKVGYKNGLGQVVRLATRGKQLSDEKDRIAKQEQRLLTRKARFEAEQSIADALRRLDSPKPDEGKKNSK